jgi:hypothetical protein
MMVVHLSLICASFSSVPTVLPSLNAFPLSSKFSILFPLSLLKIFSPLTTIIRLLLYLLLYLSISPISHFGIILTLWLLFIPIMHSSLLLLSFRIIASSPSSNAFFTVFAMNDISNHFSIPYQFSITPFGPHIIILLSARIPLAGST